MIYLLSPVKIQLTEKKNQEIKKSHDFAMTGFVGIIRNLSNIQDGVFWGK